MVWSLSRDFIRQASRGRGHSDLAACGPTAIGDSLAAAAGVSKRDMVLADYLCTDVRLAWSLSPVTDMLQQHARL